MIVVGALTALLAGYAAAPGEAGRAAEDWPEETLFPPDPARFTLVMTVHPHCPCSRASLRELERLAVRHQRRLAVHVLFVRPEGAGSAWLGSKLWQMADEIPRLRAWRDERGAMARSFGAATSGHVVMYDPVGRLVFRGGLTSARGHEGVSGGTLAITAILEGRAPARRDAPVYGCSLEGEVS